MGDEAEEDEEGAGEDEACGGEPAGAVLVGRPANQGSGEGGDDEGEEDEAGAGGGPVEGPVDEEREDGVEGGEERGLHGAAPEGGEETSRFQQCHDRR